MKRKAIDEEKIFVIYSPDKGLISRIYTEFLQVYKETNDPLQWLPIFKWAKYWNRHYIKEDT